MKRMSRGEVRWGGLRMASSLADDGEEGEEQHGEREDEGEEEEVEELDVPVGKRSRRNRP